jgi:uncharacterized protein YcbK (DUF882 family)
LAVLAVLSASFVDGGFTPSQASGQIRALKIYHLHTHERATIVFKRNGRYDQAGLKKLNMMLRDWRRNEPTRMDPRLFDLVWEVYQKSGSNDYINIVSAYRSPETNGMLRSRSKGVAEKSQHIQGKAMDFFIPGVKLAKLREIGMKFQVGGVGFYPRSGSPFVHMDVGSVRSWPRMSRQELARLFPDGRTLHRPAEGGQMPGFNQALADYKKRVGKSAILVAGGGSENTDTVSGKRKGLLASLFGGDENEESIVAADIETAKETPIPRNNDQQPEPVLTAAVETGDESVKAPVPVVRPAFSDMPGVKTALVSPEKNAAEEAIQAAMNAPLPEEQPAFVDLAQYKIPVPQMLGNRVRKGDAEENVLTASADLSAVDDLGLVPVPDKRPEIAQDVADLDQAALAELGSDEVAALAAEASEGTPAADTSTDEDEADLADSLDIPAEDGQSGMTEMAALDTSDTLTTRSFDINQATDAGKPRKGARPRKADAEALAADARPMVTEPKLTSNIIARWALTNSRVATLSKPVKAPRFVSSLMRARPTTVYAEGFTQDTAEVDPARFSGDAVNFLEVKKFEATN